MAWNHKTGAALAAWCWIVMASPVAMAQQGQQAQQGEQAQPSVRARLAAATLAEARGDTAAAVRELEQAEKEASGEQRAEVAAALAALRGRRGVAPAAAPTQDPRAGSDPVQRCIRDLELGSADHPAVGTAWQQLLALGPLAVEPLLAALPRLGPFGLANALSLLAEHADERVVDAFLALVEQRDPAKARLIADVLHLMPDRAALAVARAIVSAPLPASVHLRAFDVMCGHEVGHDELPAIARSLVNDASLHAELLQRSQRSKAEWAKVVQSTIAETGAERLRFLARGQMLLGRDGLTEDQALEVLATMPDDLVESFGADVLVGRPTWVRLGAFVVRAQPSLNLAQAQWFVAMDWWRGGDEAAAALLVLARRAALMDQPPATLVLRPALAKLVESGWRAPAALDADLVRAAPVCEWSTVVGALSADAEERAIVMWEGVDPWARRAFVREVFSRGRRWHRLAVRHLASESGNHAPVLRWCDWQGAADDVVRDIVALVERWQAAPAPAASAASDDWHPALLAAVGTRSLPVAALRPLLDAHDAMAWGLLAERDPVAALDEAAAWPTIAEIDSALARLLSLRGEVRHVELAIRVASSLLQTGGSLERSLANWFLTRGLGSPRLIALARKPATITLPGEGDGQLHALATSAAEAASVRDLDELLALVPELQDHVAIDVLRTLAPQLRSEHVPSLLRALSTALDAALTHEGQLLAMRHGRLGPVELCGQLFEVTAGIGAAELAPVARRALAAAGADDALVAAASQALVGVAGDDRTAALRALLDDARPAAVQSALAVEETARDEALRTAAVAAIERTGHALGSLDQFFANLPADSWAAVASTLLGSPAFERCSRGVAQSVLKAIGPRSTVAPAILGQGARHEDVQVRGWVADALGRTFRKDAAPYLLELLKDPSPQVRGQAEKALEELARYLDAETKWRERLR
jgi:hypothetical protein